MMQANIEFTHRQEICLIAVLNLFYFAWYERNPPSLNECSYILKSTFVRYSFWKSISASAFWHFASAACLVDSHHANSDTEKQTASSKLLAYSLAKIIFKLTAIFTR
jgi:hypothetical protein